MDLGRRSATVRVLLPPVPGNALPLPRVASGVGARRMRREAWGFGGSTREWKEPPPTYYDFPVVRRGCRRNRSWSSSSSRPLLPCRVARARTHFPREFFVLNGASLVRSPAVRLGSVSRSHSSAPSSWPFRTPGPPGPPGPHTLLPPPLPLPRPRGPRPRAPRVGRPAAQSASAQQARGPAGGRGGEGRLRRRGWGG